MAVVWLIFSGIKRAAERQQAAGRVTVAWVCAKLVGYTRYKHAPADFIWTPNWLLGTRARPGREGRVGAVGGVVPIVTTSRHRPFSEFKNIDF